MAEAFIRGEATAEELAAAGVAAAAAQADKLREIIGNPFAVQVEAAAIESL